MSPKGRKFEGDGSRALSIPPILTAAFSRKCFQTFPKIVPEPLSQGPFLSLSYCTVSTSLLPAPKKVTMTACSCLFPPHLAQG